MLKHKKTSVYSPEHRDESLRLQAEDLRWYNQTPYAHLTAAVHLRAGALRDWATCEQLVSSFRDGKLPQKSDPQFRFFVSPDAEQDVYALLERLDTRLPRFSVCPIVPIRSEGEVLAHVQALSGLLAGRLLDVRLAFLPQNVDELERVTSTLQAVVDAKLFAGFPLVELGFDAQGSGEVIEAAVATFLERFPVAVESINMSTGGYVRRFHELKEAWYLAHITGRDLRVRQLDLPRVREFDEAFHRTHADAEWYARTRHKKASVILEFDLDSIADTYECQSPVFIDGKWILDRDRLAGQIDPVSLGTPLPRGATPFDPLSVSAPAQAPEQAPAPALPERAEVVLLKMPNHNMDYPHLAIPTITAALRSKKYSVVQQDVNAQLRDLLLTADGLREVTHAFLPALAEEFLSSPAELERIRNAIAYLHYVDVNVGFHEVERVKRSMQRRQYDALLTDPYDASTVSLVFVLTGMMHIVIDLALTAEETGIQIDNPVMRFLKAKVQEVAELEPRIVGFSVIQIQRKATLWFAKRLKEVWDGLVVIGGPDPSTFRDEYLQGHPYIDVCFLKEAEQTFVKFLQGVPPEQIAGIVYRGSDGAVLTNEADFDRKASVFTPDFEGFDLDKFLLPTLPLSTSRGCHFAKCTFCNHYKTYSGYYANDAVKTVNNIEHLLKRYNTRFFHFVDDMLEVESGTAIADEIIRRGLDVNIITYARFEKEFHLDPSILPRWEKAGIRVIEWGLESASQRVLNMMIKGVAIRNVQTILDISSSNGIVNKLMLFHNYPGETVDDLKTTVDFLRANVIEKKVRPFFTVRGRYELRLFTPLETDSRVPEKSPFRKRYERSSSFDSLLGYADDDDYGQKVDYIEKFIDEMSGYLRERRIFSTNDENMSMDLIVRDMERRGLEPAFKTQ
jgi:anaerobic magnesium-protoporphyrin IX monomethyl ester cyclase